MTQRGSVVCETLGDVAVVAIAGEFDIAAADEMRATIQGDCADSVGVVIDLSETAYLDSGALRALFMAARFFQSRGVTVAAVVPADGIVRKVATVSGMSVVMPIVETRDEALAIAGVPGG